jgi:hypothetical protein
MPYIPPSCFENSNKPYWLQQTNLVGYSKPALLATANQPYWLQQTRLDGILGVAWRILWGLFGFALPT